MAFLRGDVVLVPFPYTDLSSISTRPAIVVSDEEFEAETGDIIVAMVTSQQRNGRTDFALQDWRDAGLHLPSWVRARVTSLDTRLVRFNPGRLSGRDIDGVQICLRLAIGLNGPS